MLLFEYELERAEVSRIRPLTFADAALSFTAVCVCVGGASVQVPSSPDWRWKRPHVKALIAT